jgi:hypothetical protein
MTQEIYCLSDYDWEHGTVISKGKKNYKVHFEGRGWIKTHDRYVPIEKCALPGESVCVVWEKWRGNNGRGGYRVERELYPEHRVPAEQVGRQRGAGRVEESESGVAE